MSASMMYGAARFNAWVSACGFASGGRDGYGKGRNPQGTFASNTVLCSRRILMTTSRISPHTSNNRHGVGVAACKFQRRLKVNSQSR
ncbi:hypothetical protein [Cupriavidus pauculus]|uniref:hypothetical protein n=1 Tax=Cupriavidus pauculus TaxID=82633 RepID=UPI003C6D87D6